MIFFGASLRRGICPFVGLCMHFLLDQKVPKNQDDFKLAVPGSNSKIVGASMQRVQPIKMQMAGMRGVDADFIDSVANVVVSLSDAYILFAFRTQKTSHCNDKFNGDKFICLLCTHPT